MSFPQHWWVFTKQSWLRMQFRLTHVAMSTFPPSPRQATTLNCHAPYASLPLAGQCSKSHKLTRQNCRRMPHEILMKNTSSKKKGDLPLSPPACCLPACLLRRLSAINAINCSSAQARQAAPPLSLFVQPNGAKTKPKPKLMTRPASKSVVNCKWQRMLY